MVHARNLMRLDILPRSRLGAALVGLVLLLTALGAPARAQPASDAVAVELVVTSAVLGAVVRDLVADRAGVTVLMGNGVDPHDWSPSAQDIETVYAADLVVANGLDLEEGLHDVLEEAEANGVPVFHATDAITVRPLEPGGEHEGEEHEGEEHEGGDPHFWVDPVSMAQVVDALAATLSGMGVDVADRGLDLVGRLTALDAEVRALLAPVPDERRDLVTGHESMGYFADRYGFRLVGTVIPGLSSQGEVSAQELAGLAQAIRDEGVAVIFTEIGTPQAVVDAIAAETGARVVELPSHTLPDDGTYESFIRGIASAIASALA